jgi:hypothetical protein
MICEKYDDVRTNHKPTDVYFDNAPCEFYEKNE